MKALHHNALELVEIAYTRPQERAAGISAYLAQRVSRGAPATRGVA